MRKLEILLTFTNGLIALLLLLPLLAGFRWFLFYVPCLILLALLQVFKEGARWQMIPAYILTILLSLVGILQAFMITNNIIKPFLASTIFILLTISLIIPQLFPIFHFQRPTGPYQIGTVTYHFIDKNRREIFQSGADRFRELIVQIWYPTKDSSTTRYPYLPEAEALTRELSRLHRIPRFLFHHLRYVQSNAIPSASIAPDQPRYPILIFLEGLAGFRQMNTFQVEELVSHGYIVAAIDQPYAAANVVFPDEHQITGAPITQMKEWMAPSLEPIANPPILNGHTLTDGIIPYLAEDVRFTLHELEKVNQSDPHQLLTGKMDLQHLGMIGVSLGGIVAGEVCQSGAPVQACIVIDAPMTQSTVKNGLKQPTMWLTRNAKTMEKEGWSQKDIDQHQTTMRSVFHTLPTDGFFIQLPDFFHVDFTDVPYWTPLAPLLKITGRYNWKKGHQMINAYSLAFFDQYLKGLSSDLLEGKQKIDPNVHLEMKRNPS
jgi:predicted dienelactone hydrolase